MKQAWTYALIFMTIFAMGGVNILGRIHVLEPVEAGDELFLYVNTHNPTDFDMESMSVRAIFFDLGDIVLSRSFELDDQSVEGVTMNLNIPRNAHKGDHLVKVIASNDDYYDSKYIYVNII